MNILGKSSEDGSKKTDGADSHQDKEDNINSADINLNV